MCITKNTNDMMKHNYCVLIVYIKIIPLENYNLKLIYSTHAYRYYWIFGGQFVIKILYVLSFRPIFYSYFTDQITHIINKDICIRTLNTALILIMKNKQTEFPKGIISIVQYSINGML